MPNGLLRRVSGVVLAVLAPLLLASCSGFPQSTPDVPQNGEPPSAGEGFPQENGDDTGGDGEKLIIRTKVLRLEVESTPDAVTKIRELARTHSGSVTDMQVATDSDESVYHYDENGNPVGDGTALRGWVTVRVPTDSYEDFVEAVVGIGTVKYQSEASDDVTQEHVDLSARLENLRAQEARLREFFDAAANVTEMLAIEEELGRVRGEIESLDAQVKYLERQAAMATVTLELVEPRDVVRPEGESWGFSEAITSGFRGAATLLTSLITLVIATAPLWLAVLVLFFPLRAMLRRRAANRPPKAVQQQAWAGPPPGAHPRPTAPAPPRPAPSEPHPTTATAAEADTEQRVTSKEEPQAPKSPQEPTKSSD
ncbi:DUF4349 domain-containing protein [Tessaracoccus sp. OS52]|uniref:DUF4349 domain-containing protein n=1 Tax=Tessaracoccus sp. OS52 TaxID=2886691 RepID=UPI001D105F2E|nr:DUF4349 domain-containing protein [Tessaracoccus sp. OS52]MCC2593762.1 DUF4349 domain-containing protein [Tessaracoccus sp. OS52]